ncbi:MAG: aspartate kinase [Bacteroidota bacterium]
MMIFKFGGASVRDADAVRNVGQILDLFKGNDLVVVVSAMGKTTNALEKVVASHLAADGQALVWLNEVRTFHLDIMSGLFPDLKHPVYAAVENYLLEIEWVLDEEPRQADFTYDQIVGFGELISTTIVSAYLNDSGTLNRFVDIRDCLLSDNTYREARIDWKESERKTREVISRSMESGNHVVVTQGFIAASSENFTTTLGREGSDYTAAILAHLLNAESVTIWKDVPGVLNADPKFYTDAQKLEQISYTDAIELAYYGASVIHPKTIKPLENKGIPLYVKSFLNPQGKGTVIGKDLQTKPQVPSFIFKNNQVLLSLSSRDFSFIAEDNLSDIFAQFASQGVRINLMQNSAISFSVCFDHEDSRTENLIESLRSHYRVRYNTGVQLCTIRHYYPSTIDTITQGNEVLLEQRSRTTAQLVLKAIQE